MQSICTVNSFNLAPLGPDGCWIIKYSGLSDITYFKLLQVYIYFGYFTASHHRMCTRQLFSFHHKNLACSVILQNTFLYTTLYNALCSCANLDSWKGPSYFHLMPLMIAIGPVCLYIIDIWRTHVVGSHYHPLPFSTFTSPNYFNFLRHS